MEPEAEKGGALLGLATKLGKFLAAGLPAFLLAVPLNYALVEWLHVHKPAAYAIVLVFQVSMNFFMCCLFVFDRNPEGSLLKQFLQFVAGILLIRLADWATYSFLVETFNFYYLGVQLFNVALFSVAKFFFARRVVEGNGTGRAP